MSSPNSDEPTLPPPTTPVQNGQHYPQQNSGNQQYTNYYISPQGHPEMQGGLGTGNLNQFNYMPVHGHAMYPYSNMTPYSNAGPPTMGGQDQHEIGHAPPCPRPCMNPADFTLPDSFGAPFQPNTVSGCQPPPNPQPLSPDTFPSPSELAASAGNGQQGATKQKKKKGPDGKEAKDNGVAKPTNKKGDKRKNGVERKDQLMNKLLPTGGKAWDALSATYNKWAKNQNFPECKRALLQNHWYKILNQAKDKPTGTASAGCFSPFLTQTQRLGAAAVAQKQEQAAFRSSQASKGLSQEFQKALDDLAGKAHPGIEHPQAMDVDDSSFDMSMAANEDDDEDVGEGWTGDLAEMTIDVRDVLHFCRWEGRRKYKNVDNFNNAWAFLIDKMTEAYIKWKYNLDSPDNFKKEYSFKINAVNIYTLEKEVCIHRSEKTKAAVALVSAGYLGTSPEFPSLAISL
ncbi:hypothetical protein C8J55DRAFT_487031 [Lentinula edodes]|uniref:Uncharacterized protein n=1 Tax=Lentinula lateritia TaxID=40482 RepID=A0A9W9ATA8_9AGAR|nr:hypothetical protein C8J55DRAFT_487031 [Lentinula edodes]